MGEHSSLDREAAIDIIVASQAGQVVSLDLLQQARRMLGLSEGDVLIRNSPALMESALEAYATNAIAGGRGADVVRNVICQFDPRAGGLAIDEKPLNIKAAAYVVAVLNGGWFGHNLVAGSSWLTAIECGAGHKLLMRISGIRETGAGSEKRNRFKDVLEGVAGEGLLLTEEALALQPRVLLELAMASGRRIQYLFGKEFSYRVHASLQDATQFFEKVSYPQVIIEAFLSKLGDLADVWIEVALSDRGCVRDITSVALKGKRRVAMGVPPRNEPVARSKPQEGNADSGLLRFKCPRCKKLIRVPSRFAGRKAKCPGCNAVVCIPALEDV